MPDILTPVQWKGMWSAGLDDNGDRRLALAMLSLGISDALSANNSWRNDALGWFRGLPPGRFPFEIACFLLKLEAGWLRPRIIQVVTDPERKPIRGRRFPVVPVNRLPSRYFRMNA